MWVFDVDKTMRVIGVIWAITLTVAGAFALVDWAAGLGLGRALIVLGVGLLVRIVFAIVFFNARRKEVNRLRRLGYPAE
jgi:hypothetical protein